MSLRFKTSLLLTAAFALLQSFDAHAESSLVGTIDGNQYISPTTAFRVTIPVIADLGGSITDTDNVVSFQDDFTTHQSIACFKMDERLRHEDETRGRKDYLIWFFANFVQADFQQRFAGARIESAHFLHSTQDGTLLTYNLLPGGTMFANRIGVVNIGNVPVAKRGNLLFVKNGFVFVVSMELAEKVLEGSSYSKTVAEEDAELRQRLLSFLDKITFASLPVLPPAASETTKSAQKPASVPAK